MSADGNNDWKVGDLAVCIAEFWQSNCIHTPRKEEILRVSQVGQSFRTECGLVLGFEGKPQNHRWQAAGFRKIRPDTAPADDAAWVEQLKHLRKPSREVEPA